MSCNDIKVVLIGQTGVGKSKLGNFILQKEFFKVGDNKCSETDRISECSSNLGNMKVTIIDTPGLDDTKGLDEINMNLIVEKFQNDMSIDGMILVYSFRAPRKVQKHRELLDNLITIFGKDLLEKRLKVIFTNCAVGEERDEEEVKKEKIQKHDANEFLINMVKEDDMIFVNSKKSFFSKFQQNIIDLLEKFLEIKRIHGSINNALIKKKKLKFIEQQKKEAERKQKELEKEKAEAERKQKELEKEKAEAERKQKESEKKKEEAERKQKELEKEKAEAERKQKELEKKKEEAERKQKELEKERAEAERIQKEYEKEKDKMNTQMYLKDITYKISDYETKISETKQKIEHLKGTKGIAIAGTVLNSILLPFTLGISGIGIATSTMGRNSINRQIIEYENDLKYYRRELNELLELKNNLYKKLKEY